MSMFEGVVVERPGVEYHEDYHTSTYTYTTSHVSERDGRLVVRPEHKEVTFRFQDKVPRLGIMLVGFGGNNGTTLTGSIMAHKHHLTWRERTGPKEPDFYGSVTQSCAVSIGKLRGEEVFIPFKKLLPMVDPDNLEVSGWDISSKNMYESVVRAHVFQPELCDKLREYMEPMKPLPSIYDPSFIAANQKDRADNLIPGTKYEQYQEIRRHIREFKESRHLDNVVVLWTATTERYCDVTPGIHDTWDNFMSALKEGRDEEISPSSIFAAATLSEGCPYLNGSPQNTFVPALVEYAVRNGIPYGGDDFKSGQTKMKSHLAEFLIDAGIPVRSIASYNHLGNNDGLNLKSDQQFRSKEKSKGGVIDDIIASNPILYPHGPGGHEEGDEHAIDHIVVIKYVPTVGDSKRALDEYTSEICMHGINTITLVNVCEDSLLAAPLMLDLCILAEMLTRVTMKAEGEKDFHPLYPLLSNLSYYFKAPQGRRPDRRDVINALFRQRQNLENFMRVVAGLPPEDNIRLESRLPDCLLHSKE